MHIFSKVFEQYIAQIICFYFEPVDLYYGFVSRLGCQSALFLMQTTVNYFTLRGNLIYMAALDYQKHLLKLTIMVFSVN